MQPWGVIQGDQHKIQDKVQYQSLISTFPKSTLDVLIFNLNKMNSFAYDLSHPPSLECFASSSIENEDIIPKDKSKQQKNIKIELP